MIQRRQFIGSLAALCTVSTGSTNLFAAPAERSLNWQCDVIQTKPHNYGRRAPVVTGVSLQPNGSQVAIVGDDHFVSIFDTAQDKFIAHLGDHTDWVRTTRFSPNGKILASAGNDRKLKIWSATNFDTKAKVFSHRNAIIDLVFNSTSDQLATVGFDSELRIYDLNENRVARRLRCECPDNHAVTFSDDNTLVASGGRSGVIRVWHVESGDKVSQFRPHRQRIRSIQFTPENNIVSCGDDQMVQITDLNSTNSPKSLPRHSSKLFSISLLKNDLIATAGSDNMIHIWRMNDAKEVGTLKGHTGTVSSLDFSNNQIASGSYDTQVRIWKFQDGIGPTARRTNDLNRKRSVFN